ncbi:Lateral organ boundaries LOB domain-containing protein [Dioscorea alata]|uniref:Lateral organ boundaries LOB domain-containing protein n=1 Tax=Dioscorea alata TaxID=55571 RepID=A0ACB7WEJ7_DIOAL|nr:Lateral organ boundaries LOB domain-containing protein [Dioscorea alata]
MSSPSSSSSRPPPPPSQACAACKYQRRKCNPDCTLAPFFPADSQRQFLNAHRLFGVSNILRIIRGLDPVTRAEAMRSIIFQSNARALDPVGGCYRIILDLEQTIHALTAELSLVLQHLSFYRSHSSPPPFPPPPPSDHHNLFDPQLPPLLLHQQQQQQQHNPQLLNYFWFDQSIENGDDSNSNSMNVVENYDMPAMLSLQQQEQQQLEEGGGEEDVKPIVDMFDVRQTFVDPESSVDQNILASSSANNNNFICSTRFDHSDFACF